MMPRWRLKACPRCSGDSFIDSDVDGWYEQCLMCGHRRELKDLEHFTKQPVKTAVRHDDLNAA